MRSAILIVFIVLITGLSAWLFSRSSNAEPYVVLPDGTRVQLEVASTPTKRQNGLSYRTSLESDHGMLFVFDTPDQPGFWMKDMRFAIDIIWISNGWIIGFDKDLQPEDPPSTVYYPPALITMALELPAGFASTHKLTIGDRLDIHLPKQ